MRTDATAAVRDSPSNGESPVLVGAVPIRYSADLDLTLRDYRERLGFKTDWTWGEPSSFASASRDAVKLFFCERCQGHSGTWMMVFVDDVDALYLEYLTTGAEIVQRPTDEPWGMREMIVVDLDGHMLRFGSPIGSEH